MIQQHSYDSENDLLYVTLADNAIARTVQISETCFVDIDDAGQAVGIEVLDASHGWPVQDVIAQFHLEDIRYALVVVGKRKRFVSSPAGSITVPPQPAPA